MLFAFFHSSLWMMGQNNIVRVMILLYNITPQDATLYCTVYIIPVVDPLFCFYFPM